MSRSQFFVTCRLLQIDVIMPCPLCSPSPCHPYAVITKIIVTKTACVSVTAEPCSVLWLFSVLKNNTNTFKKQDKTASVKTVGNEQHPQNSEGGQEMDPGQLGPVPHLLPAGSRSEGHVWAGAAGRSSRGWWGVRLRQPIPFLLLPAWRMVCSVGLAGILAWPV